ncbi:MAG: aspartate/glutamate racemase family protein [Candidatus Thorarchaeota archaeon]
MFDLVKHIGIVCCSAEGAALCYKTICIEAQEKLFKYRHPEITLHTPPLADYMQHIWSGNWEGVAALMLKSAEIVAKAGADFAICPDNTIHQAYDLMISKSPIPWLHIAEVVAEEAKKKKYKHLGILGTKYLMNSPVYPDILKKFRITSEIPEVSDQEKIDRIIFEELVNGIFSEESRKEFNRIIQKLAKNNCDAIVLGCTEIPLLVNPDDCQLPTLDSTRLLARAAIKKALE